MTWDWRNVARWNSINYVCLLSTWAEKGKIPGQANRNDVQIKQSCDKLSFYNQQCSDMESVTQSHEVEDRGYSPVHTCANTTLKKHSSQWKPENSQQYSSI